MGTKKRRLEDEIAEDLEMMRIDAEYDAEDPGDSYTPIPYDYSDEDLPEYRRPRIIDIIVSKEKQKG